MVWFFKNLVLFFPCVFQMVSYSVGKTTMVVQKHNINDQAVSGSGYHYSMHSGSPEEYQKGRSLEILEDLGYDGKSEYNPLERYGSEPYIENLSPIYKGYHSFEPHGPPSKYNDYKFNVNNVLYHLPHPHGVPDYGYIGYPYAPGYKHHHDYDHHHYRPLYEDHFEDSDYLKHKKYYGTNYAKDDDDKDKDLDLFKDKLYQDEEFSKKGGKKYEDEEYSKKGEEEKKGYNKEDKFDKELKGKHEDFDKKSYYGEKGGHKDSHYEKKGNYNEHYAKGGSHKGGSFGEKGGHKKGQQTKGYHKVLHKDEYKKEHKFYDQADKKGFYDKYGNYHKHHDAEEGAFKKEGSLDEGHDEKEYGKKESADKGHYDKKDEGFKGEKGQEEYYSDFSDYGSKGGKSVDEEEGHNSHY